MEHYDSLAYSEGIHIISVSLQCEDYKGSFMYETRGNCKGMALLSHFDISICTKEDIKKFCTCNCSIELLDDGLYALTLMNKHEEKFEFKVNQFDFMKMVIGVCIIDFKEFE